MAELTDSPDKYTTTTYFSLADIQDCIDVIPALIWRIEVVKNKIEYLNQYQLPGLGKKSILLLRNISFSKAMIIEEDFILFENFLKAAKERQPSTIVFRIKLDDGLIRWLRITGTPVIEKSSYYTGYIADITDTLEMALVLEKRGSSIKDKITLFDNPVVLIEFSKKKLYAANQAFHKIFGFSQKALNQTRFSDFLGNIPEHTMERIYEEIIFHRQWSGELELKDDHQNTFFADAVVKSINREGKNLLWFSIHQNSSKQSAFDSNHQHARGSETHLLSNVRMKTRQLAKKGDIIAILNTILKNQPSDNPADSILYSDIHIDSDKIVTYGVGPSFESLEPGKEYPYEGTIAENIIKFNLDHIIVENTLKSIKPIDWALFIPNNVQSYFAKPLYEAGVLRTVLIFCSREKSIFTESNIHFYDPLFPMFQEGLHIWKDQNSKSTHPHNSR